MGGYRKRKYNHGKWAVQKERLHVSGPPPAPRSDAHAIGDLVPNVMRSFGLEARVWESQICSDWTELVGEQVANHTRPGRLDNGCLYIFVSSSAWLSELMRYGKIEIEKKLQQRFGANKIRSIRFQLDPDGTVYGK